MVHTITRTLRRYYLGVVFGCYLFAFTLAFILVFALPIGALALVFVAVMALIPVVAFWSALCAIERRLALCMLRSGSCPQCRSDSIAACEDLGGVAYRCQSCRGCFSARGEDVAVEIG